MPESVPDTATEKPSEEALPADTPPSFSDPDARGLEGLLMANCPAIKGKHDPKSTKWDSF